MMLPVEELAAFMNEGWPGPDWYLTGHAEYLWENTFTQGRGKELYRPRCPGKLINLYDYDAMIRWQGSDQDPTRGRGYRLMTLFRRWQRTRREVTVVVCVPHERLRNVLALLDDAGCLLVNESDLRDALAATVVAWRGVRSGRGNGRDRRADAIPARDATRGWRRRTSIG
jgi:hypothetical protein